MKPKNQDEKIRMEIRRDFASDGGCHFCNEVQTTTSPRKQLNLIVANDYVYMEFCPYHEMEVLSRLLNNWVRRERRGKRPWPIPKEELCYLCGDILNDADEGEDDETV